MASSESVVVNPDHLIGGHGTVRQALMLWSSRNGPVRYNTWQSLYFALLRDFAMTDEESPEGETSSDRQRRLRGLYHSIQEEVWGPDHLASGILADKGQASGAPELPRQTARCYHKMRLPIQRHHQSRGNTWFPLYWVE